MTNVIKRFTQSLAFASLSFALMIFSSAAQASLSTDLQAC